MDTTLLCTLRHKAISNTTWHSYSVALNGQPILATGWYKDPIDAKEDLLKTISPFFGHTIKYV